MGVTRGAIALATMLRPLLAVPTPARGLAIVALTTFALAHRLLFPVEPARLSTSPGRRPADGTPISSLRDLPSKQPDVEQSAPWKWSHAARRRALNILLAYESVVCVTQHARQEGVPPATNLHGLAPGLVLVEGIDRLGYEGSCRGTVDGHMAEFFKRAHVDGYFSRLRHGDLCG